jgi:hypothetical protein
MQYPQNGATLASAFGQQQNNGLMGLLNAANDSYGPYKPSGDLITDMTRGNNSRTTANRARDARNQLNMDQEGQRMTNRLRQLTLPDLIKLIQAQARQQTAQISGPGIGQIAPAQRSVIPQQYGR